MPRLRCVFVILVLGAGVFAGFQWMIWPDVASLAKRNPPTTAFIERSRAAGEGGQSPSPEWNWVEYEAIASTLKRAVLVSEDINFFSHNGFAVDEIKRAVREAVDDGKPLRGASTLTQQLVKNLWLSPSRNPWRKVKEAILTMQVEKKLSKKRIFEIYLNVVEFGPDVYGAEAAARRYFGRSATDLSPRQAAALVAGLPRPSTWYPGSASKVYAKRIDRIVDRMRKADWLKRVI